MYSYLYSRLRDGNGCTVRTSFSSAKCKYIKHEVLIEDVVFHTLLWGRGVVAERLTPPSSDQNVHGSSLAVALFVYTGNFASLCSLQPVLQMIEKFLLFGWFIGMAFSLSRFRGFVDQKSQLVGKSIQMATGDRLLG